MMKAKVKLSVLLASSALVLIGCGPDVEKMETGLAKSGLPAGQAKCLAEKADELGVDKNIYEYIANLLNEGVAEKDAVNKARRKYGADFKGPYQDARKACVQ